jgi:putative transcriptional regulator
MKNSIKVERTRLDMTQQDLADKLAVSRQTINAIEKGKFNPSTVLALKISALFNKSVNEIFELEPEDQ